MLILYLCVLIVFSLHRESLKLILVDEPLPEVVLSQLVIRASLRQHIQVPKNHNHALLVRIV
jgi:membrane-anchored glycerophosphoryl diester phosphodiesterase (GDPDase)